MMYLQWKFPGRLFRYLIIVDTAKPMKVKLRLSVHKPNTREYSRFAPITVFVFAYAKSITGINFLAIGSCLLVGIFSLTT